MAPSNPVYTDATADTIDYKPLSPLAVAGLIVAGLYGVLLLVNGGAAFIKGEPLFLGGWTMALPIGGAVLSGLGLWQIMSSEGTRAGASLAKWGLGISLVAGLGYFTYQTFTGLAILQQANRFLLESDEHSGFFPRLQGNDNDVRTAFLFTLDSADRAGRPENPSDMERLDFGLGQNPKGRLTLFLENPLVHLVRFTGTLKAEPLAVRDWSYEGGAYRISRTYRLTTDEGVYEVPILVSSIEPLNEGEKRRWKVEALNTATVQPISHTELGIRRQGLRHRAFDYLNDFRVGWFTEMKRRRGFEFYLGTMPPSARTALTEQAEVIRKRTPLIALAGTSLPPLRPQAEEALLSRLLPGYRPISKAVDYFKMDKMRVWDAALLPNVQTAIKQAFSPDRLPLLMLKVMPDDFAPCKGVGGEMQITYQTEFIVPAIGPKGAPMDVLLLSQVVVAAPENLDPAAIDGDKQWRVVSAEILRALEIPKQQ